MAPTTGTSVVALEPLAEHWKPPADVASAVGLADVTLAAGRADVASAVGLAGGTLAVGLVLFGSALGACGLLPAPAQAVAPTASVTTRIAGTIVERRKRIGTVLLSPEAGTTRGCRRYGR